LILDMQAVSRSLTSAYNRSLVLTALSAALGPIALPVA
jgi:hypothetical protein